MFSEVLRGLLIPEPNEHEKISVVESSLENVREMSSIALSLISSWSEDSILID